MKYFFFYLGLGIASACSSTPSTNDGGVDASSDVNQAKDAASDVVQSSDAPSDVATSDATSDASDGGSGNFTLTINDYLNWCNVSVNGTDAGNAPGSYQFAPDASVALHGDTANASLFYWGYFQAPTLADGGKDTNKDVTIQMNGDVTVLVCCPDLNTPLSCP